MRITIVYNQPAPSRYDEVGESLAITSVLDSVKSVEEALKARGHSVSRLGLTPPWEAVASALGAIDAGVVFNLFEGFDGRSETEWMLARELEALGRPYTGGSSATLELCLNKAQAKERFLALGIPTAKYQLLENQRLDEFVLPFPVIVKAAREDASHGLNQDSVVYNREALARQVEYIQEQYGPPVLVEQFLPGREFTVSIVGGAQPRMFPPSELRYASEWHGPPIMTYAAKWWPDDPAYKATTISWTDHIPNALARQIEEVALAGYRAVGSPPYARVDLRADAQERLHILEINPNPDLWPEAGLASQTKTGGLEYVDLIETIVKLALNVEHAGERPASTHAA